MDKEEIKHVLKGTSWRSQSENLQYDFKDDHVLNIRRVAPYEIIDSTSYSIAVEKGHYILCKERESRSYQFFISDDNKYLSLKDGDGKALVLEKV